MGSSSDESFVWTNASNSSNSSIDNNKIVHNKMTENGVDDESDYGSNYKKKLHEKLFINNGNSDKSDPESNQKKNKKKKRKMTDSDSVESPKKKKIKLEPESDRETPKKKKKKKLNESQESMTNECMSQNYSNLNVTIKEEQGLISPPPKSRKQRQNTQSNTFKYDYDSNMSIKKDFDETQLEDTNCTVNNEESYTKKKKKKSKKRQHSPSDGNMSIDGEGNEDTVTYSQHNEKGQIEENKKPSAKKEKSKHKQEIKHEGHSSGKSELSDSDITANQSRKSNHILKSPTKQIDNIKEFPEKANKRESRISDRIHFEDANNSQIDTSINQHAENRYSKKLKKFLNLNQKLTQIPFVHHNNWALSANDEIWAINCPQNIDVNSFLGTNIKLDRKCKIKVDNQTYVGCMNNESPAITLLSSDHNSFLIRNLSLSGTLHLRRKIPKVHVPDDNVILDNHADFVPLPDTKNRHPLFGSNYKKAIKVPSAVAQRLSESYTLSDTETKKNKKKKNKSDKNKSMDIDIEIKEEVHQPAPEDDIETTVIKKKKSKKRKHESETESSKAKRLKHTGDSSAVWESEKAIEENLFNF